MTMRTVMIAACAALLTGCFLPPRESPVGNMQPDGGPGGDGADGGGYSYAGCDVPEPDYGCPGLGTFMCAANIIRASHAACTVDADCVLQDVDDPCTGYDDCQMPAVAASQAQAFKSAFEAEAQRYCAGNGGCISSGTCPAPPAGGYRPACVQGLCTSLQAQTIAHPPALTEAQCLWTPPSGASCPADGPCLVRYTFTGSVGHNVVLTASDLGDEKFQAMSFVTNEHLFFTTSRSVSDPPGPTRFVALPASGFGLMSVLQVLPATTPLLKVEGVASDFSPWESDYSVWFIRTIEGADGQPDRELRISRYTEGLFSASEAAASNVGEPVSNAVASDSEYLVAHPDGLYRYQLTGRSRLVEQEGIRAIAATPTHILFSACDVQTGWDCTVYRYNRITHDTTAYGGFNGDVHSLAVVGGQVFGLTSNWLFEVPLHGETAGIRFMGDEFPQLPGTLLSTSLRADWPSSGPGSGRRLFLQRVCHFDADKPGYGSIELDPSQGTARWLNIEPGYPFVWNSGPVYPDQTGMWLSAGSIYVLQ